MQSPLIQIKEGNIVRVISGCHWELRRFYNWCGLVLEIKGDRAEVMLTGYDLSLKLDYLTVVNKYDIEASNLIYRVGRLMRSRHIESNGVVMEILRDFAHRPYPKINEQEENFLSVVENYIHQRS